MDARLELASTVRHALAGEPRIGVLAAAIEIAVDEESVATLAGELPSLALKKLALRRAAAVSGVSGLVDRLRVAPAVPMGDAEIRDHLAHAFLQEPAFQELEMFSRWRGEKTVFQQPATRRNGFLELEVADGIVVLNGSVPGLDYKRLAGVLSWWVPGVRDVVNGIAVDPPEEDNPELIEDAVKLAFEKDRLVNESQIRVGVLSATVRLTGLVATEAEREMAECDAWAVFGVDDVINHIRVHRPAG
jgi:osmotically-inducible protein OsmY